MLFKRRDKQSFLATIKNYLKASLSPKRTLIYLKHRILRMPHSTRDIALGLSSGIAISWTPTFGFHLIQCFIFCKIVKANFPAAAIGSVWGNPWTFPFLMWGSYVLGSFVVDILHLNQLIDLKTGFASDEKEAFGIEAFFPTLIGGYLLAVLSIPIFYYIFYYLIKAARKARQKMGGTVKNIKEKRSRQK
ncbi:MAG: DUF2062 domain-containing protein [Pseudomonadota bacterium]